jgi:GTP-binding protein
MVFAWRLGKWPAREAASWENIATGMETMELVEGAAMKHVREDIRNIAIIAHVDHGKTTLVDGLLKQSKVFRENQQVGELIMDSNELERERGITILAKNTAVRYKGVKINIIDTPGHADFGGEVERVLNMADGCLLLVDAVEGPMPQTRFVLRKAFDLGLRPILVINKIDRRDARVEQVLGWTQDLFLEMATRDDQLDFPVIYTIAREGIARMDPNDSNMDLTPLFEAIIDHVPAPVVDAEGAFQMQVTTLDYDDYKGKYAIGRIKRGSARPGMAIAKIDRDGEVTRGRATYVFTFDGLSRREVEEAQAGDIVAIAGMDTFNISDTLTDPDVPDALPNIAIEEPTLKMTFGVNTSPFAGREGKWSTSRQLRARLYHELETNVSLRVEDGASADEFVVSGRGELHLAVLIETMRREGYELQVSRPEVITHEENGQVMEPVERLVIDTREDYVGAVTENVAWRKARLANMVYDGAGNVRLEYDIPTRGLIGLRNEFLTLTQGNGAMGSLLAGYEPWMGVIGSQRNGALIASETGVAMTYGLNNSQSRGSTFVDPGTPVYEGMIVGLHIRPDDLVVNVCKEKKQTNVRSSTSDIAVRLSPTVRLSLEQSLDFINSDELVEVTPQNVRLRKRLLTHHERSRAREIEQQGAR